MIRSGNPLVDADEVASRVVSISRRRRRPALAPDRSRPDIAVESRPPPGGWRESLRGVPVLGPAVVVCYRVWKRVAGPARGLMRSVPLVGPALRYIWGLLQAPRFRTAAAARMDMLEAELERLRSGIEAAEARLRRQQHLHKQSLWSLEDRLASLEGELAAVRRAPARPDPRDGAVGDGHATGPRGAIPAAMPPPSDASRAAAYLPYVRAATEGAASPCCVDLRCGPGGWLRTLADDGLASLGFDPDPAAVVEAHGAGLDARLGDGLAWLEGRPPGSVDVLTAFRVIEGLSPDRLSALFAAAHRALSTRGVAIFESPNPENVQVLSGTYRADPSAPGLVPPSVAEFLIRRAGFDVVAIVRINPDPGPESPVDQGRATDSLHALQCGPRDYAVIVRKPREQSLA